MYQHTNQKEAKSWHARGAHLVVVCKQLLADFAGSILEMYSHKVSANCHWRSYRCAEMRLALWGKIQVEISSHAGVTVVMTMLAYDLNWKVFRGSIWIQKKYTWRELPVFFMVSTHNAISVTCKIIAYCRKNIIIVSYLCLSLFPPLSRTPLCIRSLLLISGKVWYSLDTCHRFSSTNTAIIMSNIVLYSMDVPGPL